MATRKKSKKRPVHRDSADEHAATELVMYIENTSDLSPDGPHGQGHSVLLNALRKWRKRTYDPALAVRLFEYLTEAGAKRYSKEIGSSPKEWSTMFNPATRHEAAKQLEASFRSYAENGEYDHVDTRVGMHEQMRAGMTDQNLVPFHSWPELMTYARAGGPLFYKAPMDHRATRFTKGHGTPNSYEVHARTLRIWPPGSVGRGRSRTADPFTADAGHLPRFFMPTDEVGGRVYESRDRGDQEAYGLTFAEWLDAAGGIGDRDPSMLRSAWLAGEDPSEYTAERRAERRGNREGHITRDTLRGTRRR